MTALNAHSVAPQPIRRIMVGMVLGVLVGYLNHRLSSNPAQAAAIAGYFSTVTDIFLRLIRMIIAPLVFATLVSGIASFEDSKAMARIAVKALAWFAAASLLSLGIGLLFVDVLKPGIGLIMEPASAGDGALPLTAAPDLKSFIIHLFPRSLIEAMAGNDIIQIVVFATFFGLALSRIGGEPGRILKLGIEGLLSVMLRITRYVMAFAPLGIFAALAAVITQQGLAVLVTYGKFLLSFYAALLALWLVLLFSAYAVLRQRLVCLLRVLREPMMIAFSTASSEAAYPRMIECLQSHGVSKRLTGLVLPLGYSFNLDGSMIYQAFASLFIAQAFHIPLSLTQQITLMLVLMISSKGAAAVPRGSLVVVAATLPLFGLPESGLLIILGIDQFLDMGRTATNVLGNGIATAVIAHWEGEICDPPSGPPSISSS